MPLVPASAALVPRVCGPRLVRGEGSFCSSPVAALAMARRVWAAEGWNRCTMGCRGRILQLPEARQRHECRCCTLSTNPLLNLRRLYELQTESCSLFGEDLDLQLAVFVFIELRS